MYKDTNFTVKELIDVLSKFPQDDIVTVRNDGEIAKYVEINEDVDNKICYIDSNCLI